MHIQASQAAPDLPVRSREEKSSRQVAMEAKFRGPANMAEKQKTKKLSCMSFLCMITLRNKTVAYSFLPSFDTANGSLCQKTCSVQEILLPWLRGVLSVISSSPNYYLQSQHGAEPVEDRRTLHVTLPGVNCTPFKLSSFTVMDWTLSVILLTSAMFKLDEACGEVVLPINPSLSSFSMLFNFTETGEELVEISSSLTQILGSLFSSGWPFSKMDSSICEVNLCCSVMWLCSCFSEKSL